MKTTKKFEYDKVLEHLEFPHIAGTKINWYKCHEKLLGLFY